MVDAALARARARALGANKATAAPAQASTPKSASSGRTVVLPDGTKVPEEYYDLTPADQQRLVELIKEKEAKKADDSLAIRMVGEALDWVDRSKAQWSKERSELLDVIAGLSARVAAVEQQDRTLQVQKSDALTDQQVELSQMTVNLQAVGAEQEANHQRRLQESEEQASQHRQRLEATERLVSDQEGRLKSSGTLFQERTVAIEDKLAAGESRQQKLDVQQQENSNGITANRDTLRAVTGVNFTSEIEMAVRRSFDDRLEPAMEELIARKYVTTAPTTGTDGYDPQRDNLTKPFLAEQVGDNPTERAVNRALRNKR